MLVKAPSGLDVKSLKAVIILSVYLGYLLIAGFYPFEFSPYVSERLREFFTGFLIASPPSIEPVIRRYLVEKFLLYIPLGILLYYTLTSLKRTKTPTILLACICGGLVSFLVELCQVFFPPRDPSALDVLTKTLGASCGALLAGFCPNQITNQAYRFLGKFEGSRVLLIIALLCGSLPCVFFMTQFPWLNFRNWDARFTFQMGAVSAGPSLRDHSSIVGRVGQRQRDSKRIQGEIPLSDMQQHHTVIGEAAFQGESAPSMLPAAGDLKQLMQSAS
jgi:VanZ family protein